MNKGLNGTHFGKIHWFHQSVHSADADVYAIITFKTSFHFIGTKMLIGFGIKFKNTGTNIFILLFTLAFFMVYVFVIGAAVNI